MITFQNVRLLCLVVHQTDYSFRLSWAEEPKAGYDHVLDLRTAGTGQRAPRAYAY